MNGHVATVTPSDAAVKHWPESWVWTCECGTGSGSIMRSRQDAVDDYQQEHLAGVQFVVQKWGIADYRSPEQKAMDEATAAGMAPVFDLMSKTLDEHLEEPMNKSTSPATDESDVEALASLLCDLVDGNGYWARAGHAMRERYRHAARCLLASDWLSRRDAAHAEQLAQAEARAASRMRGENYEAAREQGAAEVRARVEAILAELTAVADNRQQININDPNAHGLLVSVRLVRAALDGGEES